MEKLARFDRLYIHEASVSSAVAQRLRQQLPDIPTTIVQEPPLPGQRGPLSATDFSQSKRLLYVTPFKGTFFKRCPGSRPGLMCCNYFVLNLGQQCDMNCSYCYLQSFINSPVMTIYSNIDQAILELKNLYRDMGGHKARVGTGEVIDSLSLDDLTLYSRDLIVLFREFPNWTLEFKTKSAKVDQFLDLEHVGNTVVSWSINPQNIVAAEEHGTASLTERLAAARRCRDRGFPVAFHIDPMIWHPEWRQSYLHLVSEITSMFRPEEVNVISLGALRFQPEQRHMMRERFGMKSLVTSSEVFVGNDGKMRYDQALRREMFETVVSAFRKADAQWRVFLCMETAESWLGTMDQLPQQKPELNDLFNTTVLRAHRHHEMNLPG